MGEGTVESADRLTPAVFPKEHDMPIHLPVSRRQFLSATLATGAGLLLPRQIWADGTRSDPNRWALLADTHIWENRNDVRNGVKPADNLLAATQAILATEPRPAGAIIAGDCAANEGNPGDYTVLADVVRPLLKGKVPVHFALGNHDHRENFYAAFPCARPKGEPSVADKHVSILETPHANWFLLDSLQRTNYTPGLLGEVQLKWLATALDARPDKPALVVMHHTPDPGAKASGLHDTDALYEVILPRKQVKAYVFGHSHVWRLSKVEDLHLINLPATAWLFGNYQLRGWVDMLLAPGGAALTIRGLTPDVPHHGETFPLTWREG
jgi:3',5'-cyclic-AMP phosphodiesterase